MKTIVPITLDNAQLTAISNLIDGKVSKRTATRAEIIAICESHIGGLLGQVIDHGPNEQQKVNPSIDEMRSTSLYDIDHSDPLTKTMARTDPGYVRGWNTVRRSQA